MYLVERLLTILGPTAVGKTDLTLRLAQEMKAPVISGDAYQVYKGLSIGTAKPSTEELKRVPHYLIDILEPNDVYSVADFQRKARDVIKKCNTQGVMPILSGGTGLYVQSLLEGYQFSDVPPNQTLREELNQLYEVQGIEGLRRKARELAAHGSITIELQDKHRLYRAIELMSAGQYDVVSHQSKDGLMYEGPVLGLMRDRESLYKRINERVDTMVQQGLFDEVEWLLTHGASPDSQAFKGIGYKEIVLYMTHQISKEEAIDLVKKNTRHFAKRQITWYKRMPYIQWIYIDDTMSELDVYKMAKDLL